MSKQFKINITSNNKNFWIEVKCVDLPFIDRWYLNAREVLKHNVESTIRRYPVLTPILDYHSDIETHYMEILKSIDILKTAGLVWPVEEPDKFNFSADWCNRVHRYFTTLVFTKSKLDFRSKEKFQIDFCDQNIINALHKINEKIHILENYCRTDHKQKFLEKLTYLFVSPYQFNQSGYHSNFKFHKFEPNDYTYHTWEEVDVVMEDEILGKHILRSFFDNDNPKNIDTSGHTGWYGGFRIYQDSNRLEIYNSKEFNEWLAKYNLTKSKVRADYPIGNIIDASHDIKTIFQSSIDRPITVNLTFDS